MVNTQINCNKYVKINKEIISTKKKKKREKKKNLNTIVDNRNDTISIKINDVGSFVSSFYR